MHDYVNVEDNSRFRFLSSFRDQTLRFLLVGKTGSGKSSTGNTIFGKDLFDTDLNFASVTSTCSHRRNECNGTLIEVMDSPGLFDTNRKQEEVASDVVQALACLHPGITAVLYVIMLSSRYTEEDIKVYERLKALLDPRVTQYMIIIFTRGEDLIKQKKTMSDILLAAPKGLQTVLQECDNRSVVFDNMDDNKQTQMEKLLEAVDKLSQAHGRKPYTCPKYSEIGKRMNEEVARRIQEVEEKEVKDTKYGQTLVTEIKQIKETIGRDKKELEEREKGLQQKQVEIEKQRKEFERSKKEIDEQVRKKCQEIQGKLKQVEEIREKQRKEFEIKEEERREQIRKKDQQMQEKVKEIEGRAEKQKTEVERKEKERNEQMRQSELERAKQLKSLQESLDRQQVSAERVEEEMKKFRQEAETVREKERREMEQQRERDRQVLENIQQQMKQTTEQYEELLEEERKNRKVREDRFQREMKKLEKEKIEKVCIRTR